MPPQLIDLQVGCGPRRIPGKIVAHLPQDGDGPPRKCVADEGPAIGEVAGIGEEEVARPHLTAVVGHPGRHDADGGQPSKDFADPVHRRPLLEAASATWIGASCGIPRVRSEAPITCENTGAATAPP